VSACLSPISLKAQLNRHPGSDAFSEIHCNALSEDITYVSRGNQVNPTRPLDVLLHQVFSDQQPLEALLGVRPHEEPFGTCCRYRSTHSGVASGCVHPMFGRRSRKPIRQDGFE